MLKELTPVDNRDDVPNLEGAVLSLADRYDPRLVRRLARAINTYATGALTEVPQIQAIIVTHLPGSPIPNILVYSVFAGMPKTIEELHFDSTPLEIVERQRDFSDRIDRQFGSKVTVHTEWIAALPVGSYARYNQAELVRRVSQGEMQFLGATYKPRGGQALTDTQIPRRDLPNRGIRGFLGAIRGLLPTPRS